MRILTLIGALAVIVGIGAGAFFLGGFYSVAGTQEDPAIVHWALALKRFGIQWGVLVPNFCVSGCVCSFQAVP